MDEKSLEQESLQHEAISSNFQAKTISFSKLLVVLIGVVIIIAGVYIGSTMNRNQTPITSTYTRLPSNISATSPTFPPTKDSDTLNWKDYAGDSFSFRYPPNWYVSDVTKENIEVASCNTHTNPYCVYEKNQISIEFQTIDKTNPLFGAKDIEDYFQKQARASNSGKNRRDITLDGSPAIRFSIIGGEGDSSGVQFNGDSIVTEYKGNLYVLTSHINIGPSGKSDNLIESIGYFDMVLSTFKFLPKKF